MYMSFSLSALIIFLLILTAAALDRRLSVKRYTFSTNKIDSPLRIALLSDLHGFRFGKEQRVLLKRIAELEPDVILMAGDMVDGIFRLEGSYVFFRKAVGIAPVYYAPGNHEYRRNNWKEIAAQAESCGIVVVSDQTVSVQAGVNTFVLGGADDPGERWVRDRTYRVSAAMEKMGAPVAAEPELHILMAHRPDMIDTYKKYNYDLVVSGHAHGGQVRIPGVLNGLYAPNQGFFPPYAGGVYWHGDLCHIVSRGLAKPLFPIRIYNRPEIVVIDLEPSEKS
jgi:predicted MPP superfamily phosphohydrolase